MQELLLIGLSLDLIGVLLLGIDLIRVQRGIASQALERRDRFADFVEQSEFFAQYAGEVGAGGDWRESQYEEGRIEYYGGFDHAAAEESFKEANALVGDISRHVGELGPVDKLIGPEADGGDVYEAEVAC